MVNNTASKCIGKKLIARNRAVQWWYGDVKGSTQVRKGVHARYISSKTAVEWGEHTKVRKESKKMAKNMVKKRKNEYAKMHYCKDAVMEQMTIFGGGMKQMWERIKGMTGNKVGNIDQEIAKLRAQNGKMVSSSKGKRETLVEHYRELGAPKTNENFDPHIMEEINTWTDSDIEASKREDSGPAELERACTRDELRECLAQREKSNAAGADNIENEYPNYGREGMTTMIYLLLLL